MTVYSLLLQQPEAPLTETWGWSTDVETSDDATEQRFSLSPVPKRGWSGSFTFAAIEDVRRHLATMFAKFKNLFDWPLWHLVVKLKAPVLVGADTLYCTTARSDFRVGAKVLIVEGGTFETALVDSVAIDHIVLVTPLDNAYSARALIVPVAAVYTNDNAAVARRGVDTVATSTFSFYEYGFLAPFINDADKVALPLHNGIPVLNRRPIGEEFQQAVSTGAEITDYGAQPSIRTRWGHSRWVFAGSFLCQRMLDPASWTWWRTFADYARGSWKPFYVPSWRADFGIHTEAVGGGTQLTLTGVEYGDHYYPVASMRALVITAADGTQHFANVTGRAVVTGNDVLTLDPALPAGDWEDQIVSFLYRCRIADDKVTIEHQGPQSIVGLNLRTID